MKNKLLRGSALVPFRRAAPGSGCSAAGVGCGPGPAQARLCRPARSEASFCGADSARQALPSAGALSSGRSGSLGRSSLCESWGRPRRPLPGFGSGGAPRWGRAARAVPWPLPSEQRAVLLRHSRLPPSPFSAETRDKCGNREKTVRSFCF